MRTLKQELVILSAFQKLASYDKNLIDTDKLRSLLKTLKCHFIACEGFYNNQREHSFMIHIDANKGITKELLTQIACNDFKQDCILYRDNEGTAYLIGIDKKNNENHVYEKRLGELKQLDKNEAIKLDSYTYFPKTDIYWGVKS